ncbi:dirigent protein [Streptomyces atroolivaceus]|uniref:dirigent protein n=1 Tax=Streptomyces atroolivaceus TaxID=66869 RepID=UPI0020253A2B|nr:dirigent protein [Streptomyces atroolivaceus]
MGFAGRPFIFLAVAVLGGSAGLATLGSASADVVPQKSADVVPQKAAATAAAHPADGSSAKSRTIRVEARLQVGEELDLGATGRGVGDQFVFSGDLASTGGAEERPVGRFGGFCVITDLERNAGQCSSTAVLPGGQITVQGEQAGIPVAKTVVNAITGGTGEFRKAHGQVTQRVLTPATWQLTFEILDVQPHRTRDGHMPSEAPMPPSFPGK